MFVSQVAQGLSLTLLKGDDLEHLIQAFLETKRAENVSSGTLGLYRKKLNNFYNYCSTQGISQISQLQPATIREFMLYLKSKGNNDGGVHIHYRTLRTLCRWYEREFEPDDWKNPVSKVKAPKVAVEPLNPANVEDVQKMIDACNKDMVGRRNKAILMFLLDTGARASEMLSVTLNDIDLITGEVLIRQGKGRKARYCFLGEVARRSLRQYLKLRNDTCKALWVTDDGEGALSYWGLKSDLRRLAEKAHVPCPSVHSFRRFWALQMVQSGKTDLLTISRLGGWSSLHMLQRYAKQTKADLRQKAVSPLDNLGGYDEH
ncbi:MAG TPA: tyrosine-type recombinase/integrase [Anaerolineales bacterium]|nr:tyrosine-type recombinase/integrase [Anaerolineales bacterium]